MDLLRLILPQLMWAVIFLIGVWLIAFKIKKIIKEEVNVSTIKIASAITLIIAIILILWIGRIASINEVPRSVIDRSNSEQMINSFDQKTKKQALEPKTAGTEETVENLKTRR